MISLLLYLVASQIPLYGVSKSPDTDPLFWMRSILASNKGSLMELGISPVITAGFVIQMASAFKILVVDPNSKDDQVLFAGAQKRK